MFVTLSTAFVFALLTVALIWAKRLGMGAALVVWLSGFTAAATGAAGPVNSLIAALVHSIGHH